MRVRIFVNYKKEKLIILNLMCGRKQNFHFFFKELYELELEICFLINKPR